jgi:hypothetical protein
MWEDFVHGPPLDAQWGGQDCTGDAPDCGGEIEEGDRIVMTDDGPAHVGCVDHSECPGWSTCA